MGIADILLDKHYHATLLGNELAWTGEFSYQNRRFVVSYKNARAKRDAIQREQIIVKIKKTLGADQNTAKLITNKSVKKFIKTENSQSVLNEQKIAEDMAWDGLHGVMTNIKDATHTKKS